MLAKPNARPRFEGYPSGWFVIGFSDELAVGQVQALHYFGQKLVLYRGEDGRPNLLDAHCAHLGASLAAGGVVRGCNIECPFHAWRYAGDGRCVEIPYAQKIPQKAFVRSWLVREHSGLLFMWHDAQGREPDYEVPTLDEWSSEGWTRWTMSKLHIRTQPREIVENVVDKAHFPRVHNTHVEQFDNVFDGHKATQRTKGVAYPVGGGRDQFEIEATYFGPAVQFSWMHGVLEARLVNAHTPVDENSLDLRFGVLLKHIGSADKTRMFAEKYAENLKLGFHQDIAIWENKLFREVPVLCDGDGPIMKLRKWYAQFYTHSDTQTGQTDEHA